MSSINLENLTADFPEDKEAIKRIADLIEGSITSPSRKSQFSANRIIDIASPISQYTLASVLQQLELDGVLTKIIRVETNEGVGIRDFTSVLELPESILNWRNDTEMKIAPENLRIYYEINK